MSRFLASIECFRIRTSVIDSTGRFSFRATAAFCFISISESFSGRMMSVVSIRVAVMVEERMMECFSTSSHGSMTDVFGEFCPN